MQLNDQTKKKLLMLAQRSISKGEIFILAKLLADKIPVVLKGGESDSLMGHTLNYRSKMDSVIFTLNDYLHISTQSTASIYAIVDRVWSWRYAVANGTTFMRFSGETDAVVDDITCILGYVNTSDMCGVVDMVADANYMHMLFGEVLSAAWL